MRIKLTRKPGQPGTQSEVNAYGERLVCVRYRYDEARGKRYKTVELIVETVDWAPPEKPAPLAPTPAPETVVFVQVAWGEPELARALRKARGVWDGKRKLWRVRYAAAVALGLTERIVWEAPPGQGG